MVKIPEAQDKDWILQAVGEKQWNPYKGKPMRVRTDLSPQTLKATRDWSEVFQVQKQNSFQPGLIYFVKLHLKIDGEIRHSNDEEHLKKFTTTKWALLEHTHLSHKDLMKVIMPKGLTQWIHQAMWAVK